MPINYKLMFRFLLVYLRISILFLILYLGSNYLNTGRDYYFQLYLPFEEDIPFFEWAIYPYLSIFFFFVIPFCYADIFDLEKLEKSFIFAIIISCILFLIFPTKLGFQLTPIHNNNLFYSFLKQVDHPHNLVPSLHVCFTSIVFLFLKKRERRISFIIFFIIWVMFIYCSVVFIHQHHLIDIFAGVALSLISIKIFFK